MHIGATRLVIASLLAAGLALAGCQDYRNEFNPVNLLCPGDFDPVNNECRIQADLPTGGPDPGQ